MKNYEDLFIQEQLNDAGLVYEKRQGLGKSNLIYVGKIQHQESENIRPLNRKNYDSGNENITTLESENLRGINTNNINLKSINPNSDDERLLKNLKNQCKLNEFEQKDKVILEHENETYHSIDFLNSLYDNGYYDPYVQAS